VRDIILKPAENNTTLRLSRDIHEDGHNTATGVAGVARVARMATTCRL